MRRRKRILLAMAALVAALPVAGSGCVGFFSRWIVEAPNPCGVTDPEEDVDLARLERYGVAHRFRVETGPPSAAISFWVLEPAGARKPAGTVFVLHGIRADRLQVLELARAIAAGGHLVVLPDLRGHGASSGCYMSFGVRESQDMEQLADFLAARDLLAPPLAAVGFSYGGAVALQWSARDPRIQAAVGISTFTTLREITTHYSRRAVLGLLLPQSVIDGCVDEAGKLADFDPDEASPLLAVQATSCPILIAHGTEDIQIPLEHGKRLHEAARSPCELYVVEGAGHLGIIGDASGELRKKVVSWLAENLPSSAPERPEAARKREP